jgi:hypothetical protein
MKRKREASREKIKLTQTIDHIEHFHSDVEQCQLMTYDNEEDNCLNEYDNIRSIKNDMLFLRDRCEHRKIRCK